MGNPRGDEAGGMELQQQVSALALMTKPAIDLLLDGQIRCSCVLGGGVVTWQSNSVQAAAVPSYSRPPPIGDDGDMSEALRWGVHMIC